MRHLAGEIVRLQTQLDREIHRRRDALGWQIRHGLVEFERDVAIRHRKLRLGRTGRTWKAKPSGS
jgi:hypothetical protein